MFQGPPQMRRPVEHAVDELVAIGRTEALCQTDGLVDDDAKRYFRTVLKFVTADEKHGVFDRVQLRGLAVEQRCQRLIKRFTRTADSAHQRLKILRVGTWHVRLGGELLNEVLPLAAVQLPAIQRLQRKLAGDRTGSRAALGPATHFTRRSRSTIASALVTASPPLFNASGEARSNACA